LLQFLDAILKPLIFLTQHSNIPKPPFTTREPAKRARQAYKKARDKKTHGKRQKKWNKPF